MAPSSDTRSFLHLLWTTNIMSTKTPITPRIVSWRVALVRSSHTPSEVVPWIAEGAQKQSICENHKDFVAWLTPLQFTKVTAQGDHATVETPLPEGPTS